MAHTSRKFYKDVFLLAAAEFIWPLGANMYSNFFPIHIRQLGGNDYIVSLITSIPLFLGVLAIVGGILSDRIERKYILFFGWAITIPAPLIWAYADSWQWLLVGQLIYSLTMVCAPTITLYIFDYDAPANKMAAYSIVIIGGTLGSVAGPALGGWIFHSYGTRTLYLIVFLLFAVSTLCILPLSRQRVTHAKPLSDYTNWRQALAAIPLKKLAAIGLFLSLLSTVQNIAEPYLPLFLNEFKRISVEHVGIAYAVLAVGSVLLTWIYGKSDGKANAHHSLLGGIAAFLISIALLIFCGTETIIFAAFFLRGANRALLSYIQGIFASGLTGEHKGIVLSAFISVRGVLIGLAAFAGASLFNAGPYLPLYAEGILTLIWVAFSYHRYFSGYWKTRSFTHSTSNG